MIHAFLWEMEFSSIGNNSFSMDRKKSLKNQSSSGPLSYVAYWRDKTILCIWQDAKQNATSRFWISVSILLSPYVAQTW
jgi:hypothetical protein